MGVVRHDVAVAGGTVSLTYMASIDRPQGLSIRQKQNSLKRLSCLIESFTTVLGCAAPSRALTQ